MRARRGRVDATWIHNGNSTLRQSYTQKTAYRWWRMAYFSHSACTAHGTPPLRGRFTTCIMRGTFVSLACVWHSTLTSSLCMSG